jgi:uncharacterized protein (TIGR02145 family)
MKRKFLWLTIYLLSIVFLLEAGCKKENDNYKFNDYTITDIDGNEYHTVTIGQQVWMVENLKTTRYNDGTSIPLVTIDSLWDNLTTSGYCWYGNDSVTSKSTYGGLYNWFAVNTNKLCPNGWHVPTDLEWTTLISYLGGDDKAGGKLKETDVMHWLYPNAGANNSSGFTALPGGMRIGNGRFNVIGMGGYWWSSTEVDSFDAWYIVISNQLGSVSRSNYFKQCGFSVRCIKD